MISASNDDLMHVSRGNVVDFFNASSENLIEFLNLGQPTEDLLNFLD